MSMRPDHHPALSDEELWSQVHARRASTNEPTRPTAWARFGNNHNEVKRRHTLLTVYTATRIQQPYRKLFSNKHFVHNNTVSIDGHELSTDNESTRSIKQSPAILEYTLFSCEKRNMNRPALMRSVSENKLLGCKLQIIATV